VWSASRHVHGHIGVMADQDLLLRPRLRLRARTRPRLGGGQCDPYAAISVHQPARPRALGRPRGPMERARDRMGGSKHPTRTQRTPPPACTLQRSDIPPRVIRATHRKSRPGSSRLDRGEGGLMLGPSYQPESTDRGRVRSHLYVVTILDPAKRTQLPTGQAESASEAHG
jgi:hypothetical protein